MAWVVTHKVHSLDGWPMAALVFLVAVIIAYVYLKFYDEPVREWLRKRRLVTCKNKNTIYILNMSCFDDEKYQNGLRNNRFVSKGVILEFVNLIESCIINNESPLSVLDIGTGLGRFAIPLAIRNDNIIIDCVDNSKSMTDSLKILCKQKNIQNIRVRNIDFFELSNENKYDIIIASEVLHLFDNKRICFVKISEILACDGCLFIRMPFAEQLITGDMYRIFPEALFIDEKRHLIKDEFYNIINLVGLSYEYGRTVAEESILNASEYVEIFKNKMYSTLHLLEDSVFNSRLNSLNESIELNKKYKHSIEMFIAKIRKLC